MSTNQAAHPFEDSVVLWKIGAEPDRPECVFGKASDVGILIAKALGDGRVDPKRTKKSKRKDRRPPRLKVIRLDKPSESPFHIMRRDLLLERLKVVVAEVVLVVIDEK